jgi:hypothetical protein
MRKMLFILYTARKVIEVPIAYSVENIKCHKVSLRGENPRTEAPVE